MICSLGGPNSQPFLASLNVTELKMRSTYAKLCPGEAWQLNQNPGAGHGMHSSLLWMHTLIHNCGLFFGISRQQRLISLLPPLLCF